MSLAMTKDYHQTALNQSAASLHMCSLIPKFLSDLPWLKTEEGPLLLVDYGCADGANSQEPVKEILKHLFDLKQKQIPVHVVHNDLPDANFSFLFSLVETSTRSYKREFGEKAPIYCLGSGRSFYEQVVASNSVSLAFSSTAFHWQKQKHFTFNSDSIFHWEASDEENQLWIKASLEALKEILVVRTEELRVGGRILLSHRLESTKGSAYDLIHEFIFREFVDKTHVLTREQARACQIPVTLLSYSELMSLFPNGQLVSEGSKYGLKVIHSQMSELPSPLLQPFVAGQITVEKFAEGLVKSMRAWVSPIFKSYLPESVDKDEIESSLMKLIEEEIRKDPKPELVPKLLQAYLILEKIQL